MKKKINGIVRYSTQGKNIREVCDKGVLKYGIKEKSAVGGDRKRMVSEFKGSRRLITCEWTSLYSSSFNYSFIRLYV